MLGTNRLFVINGSWVVKHREKKLNTYSLIIINLKQKLLWFNTEYIFHFEHHYYSV